MSDDTPSRPVKEVDRETLRRIAEKLGHTTRTDSDGFERLLIPADPQRGTD